jgi:hypothetical protein
MRNSSPRCTSLLNPLSPKILKALKNSNPNRCDSRSRPLSVGWASGLQYCCADRLLRQIKPDGYAGTVPCQYDFQSLSNV